MWGECEHVHLFSSEHQAGLAGEQEAHGDGKSAQDLGRGIGWTEEPCWHSKDPRTWMFSWIWAVVCVISLVDFNPDQLEGRNSISLSILIFYVSSLGLIKWWSLKHNHRHSYLYNLYKMYKCMSICKYVPIWIEWTRNSQTVNTKSLYLAMISLKNI